MSLCLCGNVFAQLRGSPELAQALARLPVTGSVLHTAAHPDDEQSTLLAYLARGRHVRTAYLSATRGDGGQNLLGAEKGEALGLLRTQELLDARRLDGAEQFFTRAFDFGFSKTSEESLAKWGHEETLADFVRVIRQYRPDVIVSVFSGTPSDGHGQHQAAGLLAAEAFTAAADPARFPEQIAQGLRPWQAKKLYQTVNRFGPSANQPLPEEALVLDIGDYDPVLGASYSQIGAEGRTWHRSQGFGGFGPVIGPARLGLVPKAGLGGTKERDLFDGIDITLDRYASLGASADSVAALKRIVADVLANYKPEQPEKLVPALASGLERVREMRAKAEGDLAFYLDLKEAEFKRALALAQTLTVEALCERSELIPGQKSRVTVTVWNRAKSPVNVAAIALSVPAGWTVETDEYKSTEVGYQQRATRTFTVAAPEDAPVSQPYWLVAPREGDRFTVTDASLIGRPESPPLIVANVTWSANGAIAAQSSPVRYRLTDTIYGSRDVRLNVVPAIAAWTDPSVQVFTPGASHEVKVRLRNNGTAPASGKLSLNVPKGWAVSPAEQTFEIARQSDESAYTFTVKALPGAEPGVALVSAPYTTGYQKVDYPHTVPQYWFHPAETKLQPLDVKFDARPKIGYIMGAGDEVPAALKQFGANLTMLEADELLTGDLSKYHVIIAGIRIYEVRPDVRAANHRLLEYVQNGGVFVVQYQGSFLMGGQPFRYGPYPMSYGQPLARVTVEDAPVEILQPSHPLFHAPNEITAADFSGWVQERGLNFMSVWDDRYTPLMTSNDPGEPPQKGGMLLARYGQGIYLYTAYAWFRQLPAGVPGAYRIWANILSLKP